MKKTVLVVSLFLLFAVSAFAGSQTLTLSVPSVLNGQKLTPGQYEVKTTIKGSTAEVKWQKDGKTVATATGEVTQAAKKSNYDSVNTEADTKGDATVKELTFRGSNTVVRFSGEPAANGK